MVSDRSPSRRQERRERQRAFWHANYVADPEFFGARESEFARWCVPILRAEGSIHEVIELGCGYGRDARFLSTQGFHVRGVDLTLGAAGAQASPRAAAPKVEFVEADALGFLRRLSAGTIDAVYSNLLLNMDFTEEEHRELVRAVHRVLRVGGLHLYSARSTSDPWYGRGKKVGPDTFDPAPHGVTMHYFTTAYSDRLARRLFDPVQRVERSEGEGDFPIRLLYVVDRNR